MKSRSTSAATVASVFLIGAALLLLHLDNAAAFSSPAAIRQERQSRRRFQMIDDLFSDTSVTVRTDGVQDQSAISTGDEKKNVSDRNGVEFTVGATVRICKEGIKAFQTNSKAQGAYDEAKNFVQSDSQNFLQLPVGLRGRATKVYEERDVLSANYPVQVKFTPGKDTDEGYDPPCAFVMHFMANEVECVE